MQSPRTHFLKYVMEKRNKGGGGELIHGSVAICDCNLLPKTNRD